MYEIVIKCTAARVYAGIPIAASGQLSVTDEETIKQLRRDPELAADIGLNTTINNGSADLSTMLAKLHMYDMPVVTNYTHLPSPPYHGFKVWAKYDNHDGVYRYDSTRYKWLSDEVQIFEYTHVGKSTAQRLNLQWNGLAGAEGAPMMKESSTLIGMTAGLKEADASTTVRFYLGYLLYQGYYYVPFTPYIYLDLVYTSALRVADDFTLNQDFSKNFRMGAIALTQVGVGNTIINPALQAHFKLKLGPTIGVVGSEVKEFSR